MRKQKEIHLSNSSRATQKIAKKFAAEMIPETNPLKKAFIIEIRGELGAGKTTFLKGFAAGIGIRDTILSPTFVIAKRFPIRKSSFENFFHIDCYRLDQPDETESVGFKKILEDRKNIVAIEWPEKIKNLLGKDSIKINIKISDKNKNVRRISISARILKNKLKL